MANEVINISSAKWLYSYTKLLH